MDVFFQVVYCQALLADSRNDTDYRGAAPWMVNDINVREYFSGLNSVKVSMPQQTPPAAEPVSTPETLPEPAPVEVETELPAPAEEPVKPKRGRKMAG